jgi:murein DD-endopeptidase MepM/ murein hydrolase activator NlpD
VYPVPSHPHITFPYGKRYRSGRRHKGADTACPVGSQVVAAVGGTVVHAGRHLAGGWRHRGWGTAYGVQVIVRCDRFADGTPGYFAGYMHLSRTEVRVGQRVAQGDPIGRSGNTGNSTGPHLHFEVQRRRFWGGWRGSVNPRKWLGA